MTYYDAVTAPCQVSRNFWIEHLEFIIFTSLLPSRVFHFFWGGLKISKKGRFFLKGFLFLFIFVFNNSGFKVVFRKLAAS